MKYPGIKGLQRLSFIDFPDHIASVIFLGGCNLSCFYCHNALLKHRADEPSKNIFEYLAENKKLVDAVVVSGGEPTIYPEITSLLFHLKRMGFKVKLDTNGLRPEVLEEIIKSDLVDYIAIDIKISPKRYHKQLGAKKDDKNKLYRSIDIVKNSHVAHEFRTTIVSGLVKRADIMEIAHIVGTSPWYLQTYKESENVKNSRKYNHTFESYLKLAKEINKKSKKISAR